MSDELFLERLLLLAAVLGLIAAIEWFRERDRAVRWRYLAFLTIAASIGAVVGAAFDAVTSRISPAYFAEGKGLGWDEVHARAIVLGAKAGASGGLVIASVISYAEHRRSRGARPEISALARTALRIIPLALVSAAVCGLITLTFVRLEWIDGARLGEPLGGWGLVHVTWTAHIGMYAGAFTALWRSLRCARFDTDDLAEPQHSG